jgi:hypothetical protein
VPSERSITSAARYLAAATRCRHAWDDVFDRHDNGQPLTKRDLVEMHGAGLGLMWTTHSTDLSSALALLRQVDSSMSVDSQGPPSGRDQVRRVLENRSH